MKTWNAKSGEVKCNWWVVDAEGQTLGRLATKVANTLRGKNKPQFTPHVDMGDFVVVLNCEKVKVTGDKRKNKIYYRHSRFCGSLKQRTVEQVLADKPEEVIKKAVRGMLPKNRLSNKLINKLKIYTGTTHPHLAQKPQAMN